MLLLAFSGTATAQNADVREPTITIEAVVERSVSDYILPAYERLLAATTELTSATNTLCADKDAPAKAALAAAFSRTIEAWADVDFLRFGPMASKARYERFAFWPDRRGSGRRLLRQFLATEDETVLGPGALERQSAAVQGLPAFERVVFSDEGLMSGTFDSYRCKLAVAIAQNMNAISAVVRSGWTGSASWTDLMESPGPDNPVYLTPEDSAIEILRAILTALDQDRDLKLQPALDQSPEDVSAAHTPYFISNQTLPFLRASFHALDRFVVSSGVPELAATADPLIAEAIRSKLSTIALALDRIGDDLGTALSDADQRGALETVSQAAKDLRDLIQTELSPALGLPVVFNALDGD